MTGKVRGDLDQYFMRLAIREAKKGRGKTSPNPCVGAVLVKDGSLIGKGYHKRAGMPHAEVEALSSTKEDPSGATLYVTLEPCNHYGRTPPCTEAILKARIKRVVIGTLDPNPHVEGGGKERLKREGIEVVEGVLERECYRLNEGYMKYVRTGLPFVYAKAAITLDGFTATSTGDSKWITGERARRYGHRLRSMVDAVMVGSGTVLKDDPLLNVRLIRSKKTPYRVVLDSRLSIPQDSALLRDGKDVILITGEGVDIQRILPYESKGARVIRCPTRGGRIDALSCLKILGKMGIQTILLEGGATLTASFLEERMVDKFYVFVAPKLLGGSDGHPVIRGVGPTEIRNTLRLTQTEVVRLGEDILIAGCLEYPES
ncbi:MAG: bifunctional diaminohydroxyphosphoribosylaminopyrimidine deaminase/5-amino-6-(5-phosphoribosylamino)uracil reductase RibD [Desulfatiglandales bacterium]